MPTEDGVGSDKRGNFGESASANGFAPDRKPATLSIGQAESPAAELLPENSVLLPEVFDDCVLVAADPASEGSHENLPGLKHGRHP